MLAAAFSFSFLSIREMRERRGLKAAGINLNYDERMKEENLNLRFCSLNE
jgi:hypothetical protein